MTKVSYIHGPSTPADEWKDRGKQVPEQRSIDYLGDTEGELKIKLLAEQARILAAFYDDEQYQAAADILNDAAAQGIQRFRTSVSGNDRGAAFALKAISRARQLKRAAVDYTPSLRKAGLGSDLIPQANCYNFIIQYLQDKGYSPEQIQVLVNPPDGGPSSWVIQEASTACHKQNRYREILNSRLESSAHHILYNYVTNPNAQPATVAAKTVDHRGVVAMWADITGISTSNLNLWIRNGIMRRNAQKGTEPFQPEITIRIMKEEVPEASINGPFLAALPAIISAIAAAVGATVALISALKTSEQQRFLNSFQGIGLAPFGPEEGDWTTGGGGSPPGAGPADDNTILWILGGAGALLLLK